MTRRIIRQIAILTVLSFLISTAATADVVRHGSLPETYWGTWVGAAEPGTESSVIVLSAKSFVSDGASCSVVWVSQTASARGSVYSAHLQCTNRASKAGEWAAANLIIRPNSVDQIEVGSEYVALKPYRRCSAICPATRDSRPSDDEPLSGAEPK
jgi:hypothetical protein